MTDAEAYAALKARIAPGLNLLRRIAAGESPVMVLSGEEALIRLLATTARALEVAAAQLAEESHPTEFTSTSRAAAKRTVEEALATLRYGGGEERAS